MKRDRTDYANMRTDTTLTARDLFFGDSFENRLDSWLSFLAAPARRLVAHSSSLLRCSCRNSSYG